MLSFFIIKASLSSPSSFSPLSPSSLWQMKHCLVYFFWLIKPPDRRWSDAAGSEPCKGNFCGRRTRGKSKVDLKQNSDIKRKTARHSQGKRESSPRGVSQHHSPGENWLSAKDRLGTESLPAWTEGGPRQPVLHHLLMSADGCYPQAPCNTDEAIPSWSWKENLCLGQAGTEQVIRSSKSCNSLTNQDNRGEKQ